MTVAVIVVFYLFVFGGLMAKMGRKWEDEWFDEELAWMAAFFTGVSWPVSIPIILGVILFNADWSNPLAGREESRRAKEIQEAEHQRELARIKYEEERLLDEQLSLHKPGQAPDIHLTRGGV